MDMRKGESRDRGRDRRWEGNGGRVNSIVSYCCVIRIGLESCGVIFNKFNKYIQLTHIFKQEMCLSSNIPGHGGPNKYSTLLKHWGLEILLLE